MCDAIGQLADGRALAGGSLAGMGWLRERKGGEGCGNGWKCFSQIVEQRADALVLSALLLRENPRLGMGRQLAALHRE